METELLEQESYSARTTEELSDIVERLKKTGRIKGVGFDVFDTILKSLYTYEQMTLFLSDKISTYLNSRGILVSSEDCFKQYCELRKTIKNNRIRLNVDIPAKQQECPEVLILEVFGELYRPNDPKKFTDRILYEWIQFDLQNIKSIEGMPEIIAESVNFFGKEHVGIYTNNSYKKSHLLSLLRATGYLENHMIDVENVCTSSEFGLKKYGVGLRKPNMLVFKDFSEQLGLRTNEMAFIGDGENDVLFATGSGGVGIRFLNY